MLRNIKGQIYFNSIFKIKCTRAIDTWWNETVTVLVKIFMINECFAGQGQTGEANMPFIPHLKCQGKLLTTAWKNPINTRIIPRPQRECAIYCGLDA